VSPPGFGPFEGRTIIANILNLQTIRSSVLFQATAVGAWGKMIIASKLGRLVDLNRTLPKRGR